MRSGVPLAPALSMPDAACSRCGSRHLRGSRPNGATERVVRLVSGARFHVCEECGARGAHRGRARARSPLAELPGRPLERRDVVAARSRRVRGILAVVIAAALGAVLAFLAATWDTRWLAPGP